MRLLCSNYFAFPLAHWPRISQTMQLFAKTEKLKVSCVTLTMRIRLWDGKPLVPGKSKRQASSLERTI